MNKFDENNPDYPGQAYGYGQVPPQEAPPQAADPAQVYANQGMPPYWQQQLPPWYNANPAGMPPPHPAHAWPGYHHAMPPHGAYMGQPQPAAQAGGAGSAPGPGLTPEQAATRSGLASALGDIADKTGLGMVKDLFNWEDGEFWKGAMVGAAVVLLLTNDDLRNSLIAGATKTADAMKSGLGGIGEEEEDDNEDISSDADINQPADEPATATATQNRSEETN